MCRATWCKFFFFKIWNYCTIFWTLDCLKPRKLWNLLWKTTLVWSCTRLGVNNQTLSHESRNVPDIFELNATRSCYHIASISIQFIPILSGDKTGKCFLFWLIWFYWFALTSKELHGITRSDRNRMSQNGPFSRCVANCGLTCPSLS